MSKRKPKINKEELESEREKRNSIKVDGRIVAEMEERDYSIGPKYPGYRRVEGE